MISDTGGGHRSAPITTMQEHAPDYMLDDLIQRLLREGHMLSTRAINRIHAVINDAMPDQRVNGSQKNLADFLFDRIERDKP